MSKSNNLNSPEKRKAGPKTGRRKLTIQNAENALRQSGGLITYAARLAGVSFETIRRFVDETPHLQEVLTDVEEEMKDLAESKLIELIKAGDGASIRYYLSTKGRDRGYGNQTAITGADGGAVKVEVSVPDLASMTDEQLEKYIAFQEIMLEDDDAA